MAEEKALAVCDMQQFQDPKIDDGTALKLAVLLSGEEATAADVCTDPKIDDGTALKLAVLLSGE